MEIKCYAKINLSLDVLGRREDGYHNISSLMQDIGLYDVMKIEKCSEISTKRESVHCNVCGHDVYLCMNTDTIPLNEDNLAIRGAKAILGAMDRDGAFGGVDAVSMFIDKRLPVAAGIAGGSGNAAGAMLGINAIAGFPYSVRELMDIGVSVGADVPFSIMMNAYMNAESLKDMKGLEGTSCAAWISGIGDIVEPTEPIHRYVIMANPGISVSTKAAYEAIDDLMDYADESGLFTNQLEKYTLSNYPEAMALKDRMSQELNADLVLMSGSGPTMVAYYQDPDSAEYDFRVASDKGVFDEPCRAWLTETGIDKEELVK